jgi:hypothetical protein
MIMGFSFVPSAKAASMTVRHIFSLDVDYILIVWDLVFNP